MGNAAKRYQLDFEPLIYSPAHRKSYVTLKKGSSMSIQTDGNTISLELVRCRLRISGQKTRIQIRLQDFKHLTLRNSSRRSRAACFEAGAGGTLSSRSNMMTSELVSNDFSSMRSEVHGTSMNQNVNNPSERNVVIYVKP